MISEKFRYQLRQEAEQWQTEGLINEDVFQQLAHRYQFAELETTAQNRFTAIFVGLGGILLGLAVITFVAANWQAWPRSFKAIILMGLLIAVNAVGFYQWRNRQSRWSVRLGIGLLLAGALIFGANLGLMSQMFHLSGSLYQLFLIWVVGVLPMAYCLRLTGLGILAMILAIIAYFVGTIEQIPNLWIPGQIFTAWTLHHFSLLVSLSFLPLAHYCRSRWLFGLTAILAIIALGVNVGIFLSEFPELSPMLQAVIVCLTVCVPTTLLWAYRDNLWLFPLENISFNPLSRKIAIFCLSWLLFLASFNIWNNYDSPGNIIPLTWQNSLRLLDLGVFTGLSAWVWWRLGKTSDRGFGWQIDAKSTGIAAIIVISGILIFWNVAIASLGVLTTIIFNILLFSLAIALIREAISSGQRLAFWGGIVLLVCQLLSRMLEYDTGLLLKAFVLFLCGIAVIIGGFWFEQHRR